MACVFKRALAVGVERDLDLDHLLEARALAVGSDKALADLADQVGVKLGVLPAGADESLGNLAGHRGGKRAGGGNPDRHLRFGLVVDRRAFGAIELAGEADPVLGPQFVNQSDRLAQPVAPFLGARPLDAARRHLVQRLAGADAKYNSSRKHRSERAENLRDDRRVVAKGRGQHAGADYHPARARAERAEPSERRRRMAVSVLPRLEMVADKDRVEPDRFGQTRKVEQFTRSKLFGRRFVSELQQRLLLYSELLSFTHPLE